jgi:hypothetical protein
MEVCIIHIHQSNFRYDLARSPFVVIVHGASLLQEEK